jgi:hypothetical protein
MASRSQRKCARANKDGKPCGNFAKQGERLCASHLGKAGRKSLLTDTRTETFLRAIRTGAFFNLACAMARISEATGYSWRERGEADRENDIDSPYRRFVEDLEIARAEAIMIALAHVRQAGREGNWKAEAWFLERCDPRWRLGHNPDKSTEGRSKTASGGSQWDLEQLDAEELRAFLRLEGKAKISSEGPSDPV